LALVDNLSGVTGRRAWFVDIHPERQLSKLLRHEQFTVSELLAYFRFRRIVLLRVLTSLKAEHWSRSFHEEGKKRKLGRSEQSRWNSNAK